MLVRPYRFRIYPNKQQRDYLTRLFGCGRHMYNTLLADSTVQYEDWKKDETKQRPKVGRYDLVERVTVLKQLPEHSFLNDVSGVALQQKAIDLAKAFQSFFSKKSRYPKFKKKTDNQSVRLVGKSFSIIDSKLCIARCDGLLKVKWSRTLPGIPSSVTISKSSTGEFYASFICKDVVERLAFGENIIGIDFGLKDFITTSDGEIVKNPKYYVKRQLRLRRAQRSLARKLKGGNNREKARVKVARIHRDIGNLRKDFLHKLSRTLINENQVTGIENLNVRGMSQNRKLAKHVLDGGWNLFAQFVRYKAIESNWCSVVQVDRFFPSSHLCSNTGKKLDRKLKLSERMWQCSHCGLNHDRDINAAINIRNRAIAVVNNLGLEYKPGLIYKDTFRAV